MDSTTAHDWHREPEGPAIILVSHMQIKRTARSFPYGAHNKYEIAKCPFNSSSCENDHPYYAIGQ